LFCLLFFTNRFFFKKKQNKIKNRQHYNAFPVDGASARQPDHYSTLENDQHYSNWSDAKQNIPNHYQQN